LARGGGVPPQTTRGSGLAFSSHDLSAKRLAFVFHENMVARPRAERVQECPLHVQIS
jgi:hypothetical protein